MGMHQDHAITRPMPTMAELKVMAENIDSMLTFSSSGELFINNLPARPNELAFVLAVHELTQAITG